MASCGVLMSDFCKIKNTNSIVSMQASNLIQQRSKCWGTDSEPMFPGKDIYIKLMSCDQPQRHGKLTCEKHDHDNEEARVLLDYWKRDGCTDAQIYADYLRPDR